jgi:hypothetical protein
MLQRRMAGARNRNAIGYTTSPTATVRSTRPLSRRPLLRVQRDASGGHQQRCRSNARQAGRERSRPTRSSEKKKKKKKKNEGISTATKCEVEADRVRLYSLALR